MFVAFNEETVFMACHVQFHAVAAFHLEGDVVVGGVVVVVMIVDTVVMVAGNVGPLGHHRGIHCQPGRVVVFVPLQDDAANGDQEDCQKQHPHQAEHDAEEVKIESKAHGITPPFWAAPALPSSYLLPESCGRRPRLSA